VRYLLESVRRLGSLMSDRICLIVDDEPSIRAYLRAILEREHIQSLEADTAAQALRIVQKLGGRLDLVITDIKMPGDMDGIDLAHSLRNAFPEVPVILISGFAEEPSVRQSAAGFEFIRKPFVPEAIRVAAKMAMSAGGNRTATGRP
jgi:DNA-binding NtrC family response regulator